MIRRFAALLPEFRPLMFVLKQFLRQHALNIPYQGGISSYSLSLMMIGFLQLVCLRQGKPVVEVDVSGWMTRAVEPSDLWRASTDASDGCSKDDTTAGETDWSDVDDGWVVPSASTSGSAAVDVTVKPAADNSSIDSQTCASSLNITRPVYQGSESSAECSAAPFEFGLDSLSPSDTATGLSYGQLLLEFLEFFGGKFEASKWGLSVRVRWVCMFGFFFACVRVLTVLAALVLQCGGFMFSSATAGEHAAPITLEDPLFPGRNSAAACFGFQNIAAEFEGALLSLSSFTPSKACPTPLSVLVHKSGFADRGKK